MRAAGITALGEPVEIFEVDELATPAAGDVLIDVVAAGMGNWDELVRIGSWQIGGPTPMALGTEAAGTAAAASSGVAEVREGRVTGGLLVQLAAARGARVIATASAKKAERIRDYGASEVLDYHGDWPSARSRDHRRRRAQGRQRCQRAGGHHVDGGADGGRLATITGDPPREEPGRRRIRRLRPARWSAAFGPRRAAGPGHPQRADRVRPLEQAAQALRDVVAGADGAMSCHSEPSPAPDGRAQAAQLRDGPVATDSDPRAFMAQADVLTPCAVLPWRIRRSGVDFSCRSRRVFSGAT